MYDTYITIPGDTLNSIAKKFNTTSEVISKMNDNLEIITPNMNIIVPKVTSKYFNYYTVLNGDTIYKIARDNNIDPKLLSELNGLNMDDYIYPNQVLLIPKPGIILYFTAVGDTLGELAKGLGTTTQELVNQNNHIYLQPEQLIVYKYR